MHLRRKLNAWKIRRRLKQAPYFEDFTAVSIRKSMDFACYLQARACNNQAEAAFFRSRYFKRLKDV